MSTTLNDAPTDAQLSYLAILGVSAQESATLTRREAAERIQQLRQQVTPAQRLMLERFKVPASFIARMTKDTAALTIELLIHDKKRRRDEEQQKRHARKLALQSSR